MENLILWIVIGVAAIAALAYIVLRKAAGPNPGLPEPLRAGNPLPDFEAASEDGEPVSARDLRGAPAVILFIRGNWCPFCTKQVEGLTQHYKSIVDKGARLIFVTPKPLDTTRRVAEFFNVDFEFWLDDSLQAIRSLGLLLPGGVPSGQRESYGEDTVWPTALVVDADGTIRYSAMSRFIFDRPNPERLDRELEKI